MPPHDALPRDPGQPRPPLSIFLACRIEDVASANRIATQLEELGQKRLTVFVQTEVPFGEKYRPHVLRELAAADRLILVYTDPDQNWDACLYETGFFDGRGFPNNKLRLVVLHEESCEPPAPLKDFHAVKISGLDRGPLRTFIRQIFVEPPETGGEPIRADLMDERYSENRDLLEDAIIDAVSGAQEQYLSFATEIRIEVPKDALEKAPDDSLPEQARVFGDSESLRACLKITFTN